MTKLSSSVVVTGIGALTSSGHSIQDAFQEIKNGNSGIAPIQQWDVSDWEYQLGAEIKNCDLKTLMPDRKLLKLISRQDVIGLNAVKQALDDSNLLHYRATLNEHNQTQFNDKTGVFVGSPGNRFEQQYDFLPVFHDADGNLKKFGEKVFDHIHPMWLLRILPNNVLAYTGIQYGFKGVNENIVNHATSGTQAIAEAYRYLKQGIIDRAIVVAYECAVEPEGQIYYSSLGLLSPDGLFSFNEKRNGTILAEGAGCLILERAECAQKRDASIYGEIISQAVVTEAEGIFGIRDDGEGVYRAMKIALEQADLSASDIGVICAHGNGTVISDAGEAKAITELFGKNSLPITAYKWSLGHTLAAAGVIETGLTLLALKEKIAPGIANLNKCGHDCTGLSVSQHNQPIDKASALLISRAFASIDACLIIRGL